MWLNTGVPEALAVKRAYDALIPLMLINVLAGRLLRRKSHFVATLAMYIAINYYWHDDCDDIGCVLSNVIIS